jgi:hypothetical protein
VAVPERSSINFLFVRASVRAQPGTSQCGIFINMA